MRDNESNEKHFRDKERISRQDKRQIEHLEQENKRAKGLIQLVQKKLDEKESDLIKKEE